MLRPAPPPPGAADGLGAVSRWRRIESVLVRLMIFGLIWVILADPVVEDWPGMAVGVLAATATSLALLPPTTARMRPLTLLRLAGRFARQSLLGGLDVGWRALHPRMPMRPGLRLHDSRLPPGNARNVLRALASAVPGVLPCGETETGVLIVHCLDDAEEVDATLAADEGLFLRLIGRGT